MRRALLPLLLLVLAGIAARATPAAPTEKIACNTKKFLVEFSPPTQGAVAVSPTQLLAVTSPTAYRLSTACSAAGKAAVVRWGHGPVKSASKETFLKCSTPTTVEIGIAQTSAGDGAILNVALAHGGDGVLSMTLKRGAGSQLSYDSRFCKAA
jgi:hypothetical protein